MGTGPYTTFMRGGRRSASLRLGIWAWCLGLVLGLGTCWACALYALYALYALCTLCTLYALYALYALCAQGAQSPQGLTI